jgi:subtilisin family serine protease
MLAGVDARLDPESRTESYRRLTGMRRSIGRRRGGPPTGSERFESMAKEMAGPASDVRVVASPTRQTVATGVTIIDTDEAGAAKINAELADAEVVPDEDLALIEPEVGADTTSASSELTEGDLWHLEAIGLMAARANGFSGTGTGVTVAVLDTGIADVPEIHGKVSQALELDTENWKAKPLPQTKDTAGHGTHVAGLIAGDTVGVAPGARLANVVMIPGGSGKISDYILALEWVASQPTIAVLNMSAGKQGFRENMRIMTRVMRRVSTFVAMAIGNEGPNASRSPGNYPEVISVGASNSQKGVWASSGGGELVIDQMTVTAPKLVAPGEQVTSCVMQGGYQSWSGTSMATPILSGIVCLLLERFSDISLAALEAELLDSCENLGLDPKRQGKGQVHLPASLAETVA